MYNVYKILNVVTAFSYLGHIICDDLSDEADLKAKSRQMYAKSNTLRNKFHMCSTAVKVKLFTAYFNNVYMCALWVNYRKTAFQQFKVAYNKSYRILNRLPMRCSASNMFANGNVNSCACVLRKSIYSLMTRIHASLNPIVNSIVRGDVYCTSALRIGSHNCIICRPSFYVGQQHCVFFKYHMDIRYMHVLCV